MFGTKQTGPRGVAVVTGGTAGIGRATVRELASRRWDVALLARGQERLDDTVEEVRKAGRRAIGISVDVADHAAVDAAAGRVEDELGPIDLWVNNAFTGAIAFFEDIEPEEYERITAVTYFGAPARDGSRAPRRASCRSRCSTSTTSSSTTTCTAIRPAPVCSNRPRGRGRRHCVRPTCSPATAERSSCSRSRAATPPPTTGCSNGCGPPCRRARPARRGSCAGTARSRPRSWSAELTRRCTRQSARGATGSCW